MVSTDRRETDNGGPLVSVASSFTADDAWGNLILEMRPKTYDWLITALHSESGAFQDDY